ncbi:hypothetical protein UA08_05612 [Talaromyces atroroseus]|uniref:Uncharacterized protein n=1 Tax=Talaromyces atroroseus TaxID=1441469 RepID=A0A225AD38_TALAT|nr:hypothetical protein UA08_05612 [Talaromyces atroroseus]OKL59062.1 hypothetical protein UA08_05612 [Talaromyces atroroseus]
MGSLGADLDFEVNPVQRSKEENQERAFVAASRRKDRSLDARLESANRASMLHKKRTGKALHITKEIVEKEAMYEEVDERYQEKRLRLLKAHTSQLEAQFHRHLMATMAKNTPARISPHGGIQKMRNSSVSSTHSYFPDMSSQAATPVSPTTTATTATTPSPTSPVFNLYGRSSPSESSYVQTPASDCYVQTPLACPSYLDMNQSTGLVSPSMSPRTNSYRPANQLQSVHLRTASLAQPSPTVSYPPPRQRFVSFPDAFMYQHPQLVAPAVQQLVACQTSSPPSSELSATPSPVDPSQSVSSALQDNVLPSPALSAPSMTSNSSQNSSGDGFSAQGIQPLQDQTSGVNDFKQALVGVSENPDPEYHEFFNFANSVEDLWQIPMGNTPYDEFMNLDSLDFELNEPGF